MHPMAEVVWDLFGEDASEHGLPPGFRFHPTDEELVTFYLASKVFNGGRCGLDIVEVDLNRCEPWELPDSAEAAKMGEREWYFFSLRDRKYPTGLRTNRATSAGYWKATGKDREVHSAATGGLVGMKKTLVFYKGRAPRGEKTKWVLHEYRFEGDFSCRHACKEEWVICRIFNKAGADKRSPYYYPSPTYFLDPSSSSSAAPCLPPFLDLQALQGPAQALIQTHHPNLLHQEPNPVLFPLPFPPPGPTTSLHTHLKTQCPPNQTPISDPPPPEEALISNWLDSYLRTPLVCDMGLGPLGLLPLGSGAAHDMALFGLTPTGDCGPLVP